MSNPIVKPLNLDKILGEPKNRVALVGVELEGGWITLPPGIERAEHDGSVFRDDSKTQRLYPHHGEIPIGPMQPSGLAKSMKKYYPAFVDKTCGMHIHMSFKNHLQYSWLTEEVYQETLLDYLTRWATKEGFPKDHHIWSRLAGKSIFCQKVFAPAAQLNWKRPKDHDQHRVGHRYTVVHFCGRQNTIEVRVLPMMDTVEQALRAVHLVIDVTNACLISLAEPDRKVKSTVVLSKDNVYEEFLESRFTINEEFL